MRRFARTAIVVAALSLGLAGCGNFDPTDIFNSEMLNPKKKLPGERKPVFPEGTPGISQGVPAELVKGYQQPTEPEPVAAQPEEKAKSKPKPKPKVVSRPAPAAPPDEPPPESTRPQESARSPLQSRWPDPPPQQR
jgi:hypothetical protein